MLALLLAELTGLFLIALLIHFLNRPINGHVQVYVSRIKSFETNYFRSILRNENLLDRNEFLHQDSGENPLKNIFLILPKGHKKNYSDSCTLEIGFSQSESEADSITNMRLKTMLAQSFEKAKVQFLYQNQHLFQFLQTSKYFPLKGPVPDSHPGMRGIPANADSLLLGNYLPHFQSIGKEKIQLRNLHKEETAKSNYFIILLALWQVLTGGLFILRYVFLGK